MLQRSQDVFCFFFRVAASVKSKMKHSNGLSSKIFEKRNNKDEGAQKCLFYNYGKLQKKVFEGELCCHTVSFFGVLY